VQSVRRPQHRPVQALCSRHVQIGFVNRRHFHHWGKPVEDRIHLRRILAVPLRMAIHENGVPTHLRRGTQGHGRMHPELPGFVRRGRDHSTLIPLSADHHGFPLQPGIEQLLHRHEERVHIHMKDSLLKSCHRSREEVLSEF
jgi:hypothetical protein